MLDVVRAAMKRMTSTLPNAHATKLGRALLAGGLSDHFVCVWLTSAWPMAAGRGSLHMGTAPCKVSYSWPWLPFARVGVHVWRALAAPMRE